MLDATVSQLSKIQIEAVKKATHHQAIEDQV